MPSKTFRFSGIIGGLYAAANVFDQPQGTVPRLSNMVFTERGGLLTVDGTHVVSRPVPPPPPAGFISSGAVSSVQPPAPTFRSSATSAAGSNNSTMVSPGVWTPNPLTVDVTTPSGLLAGDVLIAVIVIQNKNFFSNSPPITPPSSDWVLAKENGGPNTQGAMWVFSYTVTASGLPSSLPFTTVPDSSVQQQAMMVAVLPLVGANNANPVDNINFFFMNGIGPIDLGHVVTQFVNDLILLGGAPFLTFGNYGGVITPGTPTGTTSRVLLQDASAGQTLAIWSQAFVGPGNTGDYTSPSGWNGAAQTFVMGIGAGFPFDGDIEGFEPTDDGSITPSPIISGAPTLLSAPLGLFFDAQKQLWIADSQSGNQGGIFMYRTPSQDPNEKTPDNVIQGESAELLFPQDVFIDGSNKIYVANNGTVSQNGFVSVFAAGATGNVAPQVLISGANTTLVHPVGVAVDANGFIYVIDSTQNAVVVFAPNESGNIFPAKVISGRSTLIFNPLAIRFDAAGNLWVAVGKVAAQNDAYLVVFAPGVSGNAIPLKQITSATLQPVTGDGGPTGLSFDAGGNSFVSVYKNQTVLKFNAGDSGASTPSATITGWSNGPWGIAIPH